MGARRWAERVWSPSGARAQRGRMERGAAKWRGRGLGQRRYINLQLKKMHVLIAQRAKLPTLLCIGLCLDMLSQDNHGYNRGEIWVPGKVAPIK